MTTRRTLLIGVVVGCVARGAQAARERQSLEAFELKRLRFVAFHPDDATHGHCKSMAFVRDPHGYVHRVDVGDYIGRHFGRVVEMQADGLRLLETVQRADGEWVQREAWLGPPRK